MWLRALETEFLIAKFKEMSFDISRTDLESFINFEDRLNNF